MGWIATEITSVVIMRIYSMKYSEQTIDTPNVCRILYEFEEPENVSDVPKSATSKTLIEIDRKNIMCDRKSSPINCTKFRYPKILSSLNSELREMKTSQR